MREPLNEFEQALLSLDRISAQRILTESSSHLTPIQFVEQVVAPALERMGADWEQGRIALSQIYMSGRICEELVDTILPPGSPMRERQPRLALAVLEDYHLLGKRIVYSTLRASGFEALDYGRVGVDDLVRRVQDDGIEVLLISTLMLRAALRVRDVRARLNENVKIIVGGAPYRFDDQLWRDVQADAMCRDASEIVATITTMMGGAS